MKSIISWNVNGIRAIEKKGFLDWLFEEMPDILCLQETKASPQQLSEALLKPAKNGVSYKTYWSSSKKAGYSGVAIFSKEEPKDVRCINIEDIDAEGRVLIANYGEYSVISAYFPNSQEEGARLDYKMHFCDEILKMCNAIVAKNENIVLLGDYNIAHKPIDLANPSRNEGNPGYLPEERAWMDRFVLEGYVDTFRSFCKEEGQYTWWSYRFSARAKNIGWRLDYACVNASFAQKVHSSIIMKDVMGSDHCPVKIMLE